MESGKIKTEQREQPVTPKKRRRPKPEKSAQANGGGSSSSAADESSSLSRTSLSSPPSDEADGKGQQQQQHQHHHEQGGGGKRPRLVWTTELHDLFVEAYDSLGDEAVPRRILEKMNEKMDLPEVSREKVASHLQKHKLNLRRIAEEAAASHSPTEEEAPASSNPLRSLPPNTTPLAEVSQKAQLELVQVLQAPPPDCLSRSSSSIVANFQIVQSIQQQLFGPPIEEGQALQPADETMKRAPAGSGCSPLGMETSTAAILVPEANTEAVIHMAQAAKAENAAEPEEAAPAAGSILAQFWASPDNEACTSSWDIFGLSSRGT